MPYNKWWSELQKDENPDGKKSYGDSKAAGWKPTYQHSSRELDDVPALKYPIREDEKTYSYSWEHKSTAEQAYSTHGSYAEKTCKFKAGERNNKSKKTNKSIARQRCHMNNFKKATTQSENKQKKDVLNSSTKIYLTHDEHMLLKKYKTFYVNLDSGVKLPKTDMQKQFIEVCRGRRKPNTNHEMAYMKHKRITRSK